MQRISPGDEFLDEGVRGVPVNAAGNAMQKRNSIRFGTLTEAVDVGLCECASEEDRDRGGVHDNQCDSCRFIESKVPWKMNSMSTSEVGTDVASCGAGQVLKCPPLCCSTGVAHHRPPDKQRASRAVHHPLVRSP